MSTTILEQIKLVEPTAKSYYNGLSNYIVVLENGGKVCLSKQSVEGLQKQCLQCKQMVKLFRTEKGWAKYNLDNTPHKDLKKVK